MYGVLGARSEYRNPVAKPFANTLRYSESYVRADTKKGRTAGRYRSIGRSGEITQQKTENVAVT